MIWWLLGVAAGLCAASAASVALVNTVLSLWYRIERAQALRRIHRAPEAGRLLPDGQY